MKPTKRQIMIVEDFVKKTTKSMMKEAPIKNTYREIGKDKKYEIKILEDGKVIDHSSMNYEGALKIQDYIHKILKIEKYKFKG